MTMLNYCGVTGEMIRAVGDTNPRKQGLFCPGTGIPVISASQLLAQDPTHIVIGPWNFRDEIIGMLRNDFGYRNAFILPLPTPEILPAIAAAT
jgi:ABC-type Fe3+-hydroxamate transport system substrate-binding protein